MLYARAITLRNCGRFTVIASDFGSDYRTHTHVTSEALYASLTRGATWKPHPIDLKNDRYDFTRTYDVAAMPIWFLPGVFVANGSHRLPDTYLDTTAFNVVHEFYPSTGESYAFRKGEVVKRGRPHYVPTYGTIQAIKPDCRLVTFAFSPERELVENYAEGQTFLLGKKRTMVQIVDLSPVVEGVWKQGECTTWWLECPLECLKDCSIHFFRSFEVLAATMRYLILRGTTREGKFIEFTFPDSTLCLPEFYIQCLVKRGLLQARDKWRGSSSGPCGMISPGDAQA